MRRRGASLWLMVLCIGCGFDAGVGQTTISDASDTSHDDVLVVPDASTAEDVRGSDTSDVEAVTPDEVSQPSSGWLAVITNAEGLAALSVDGGPVKYLSVVLGATPPAPIESGCLFQDMHLWEYHIQFLRSFPELAELPYDDYLAMVLKRSTRVLWGGAVEAWPQVTHPTSGKPGIVTYLVYSEPGSGSLRVDDLIEVDAQLEACLPYAQDRLVFVPGDEYQRQLVIGAAAALEEGDVDVISPEALPR